MIEPREGDVRLDADLNLKVLIIQHKEMTATAKRMQESADRLAAQIQEIVGTSTLVLADDRPVLSFRPTSRWAGAKFMREQPDLARHYLKQVTKEELDLELIKRTNPALYSKYQVRSMINDWDAN